MVLVGQFSSKLRSIIGLPIITIPLLNFVLGFVKFITKFLSEHFFLFRDELV